MKSNMSFDNDFKNQSINPKVKNALQVGVIEVLRPLSPMKTKPQVSYPFDAPTISSSPKNGTLASFEAFDASTSPMKSKPQVSLPFEAPTTSSSPKKCVTPVSLPLNVGI